MQSPTNVSWQSRLKSRFLTEIPMSRKFVKTDMISTANAGPTQLVTVADLVMV